MELDTDALRHKLKQDSCTWYHNGALLTTRQGAFTSRIQEIIPFMPLSRNEQAVITHKFLETLNRKLERPIDISLGGRKRYLGHSQLVLYDTKTLYTQIAEQKFVHTSGARSLKAAVVDIEDEYCKAYRNMDGLVDMSLNDGPLLKFDIITMGTATGRIKFTMVKQPDPQPEP